MFTNEVGQVVVDYGPDPADSWVRGLVGNTIARIQGMLGQKAYGNVDGDPMTSWTGPANSPQSFHGASSRAVVTVVGRDGAYPDIASGIVEGPMGDPARRIFAARLAQGR